MNLAQLRKTPHLSASSINTYIECGLQYRLAKVDQLPPEFISDSLLFGTAIHLTLESFHEMRLHGEKMPLSALLNAFEIYWEEQLAKVENLRFKSGNDEKSLLAEGKSLLTVYYDKYPDDGYQVIGTEQPFELEIPGLPVSIIGAIDLLEMDEDGTIIITDHKTSGRAFSIDEVDRNLQLTIYYMAMKQKYPHQEIILKLDTLIKTRKPRFEQFYTCRSETDQKRTIKKIKAVWQGIQNGTFIPNDTSWKCPGCAYREHCRQWFEQQEEAI